MKNNNNSVKIDGIDKKILRFLMEDARKRILEIVLECHYTTGNWSILIKVLCRDIEHLMHVLNKKIQQIEGVSRTETFISLNQQIDRQIQI